MATKKRFAGFQLTEEQLSRAQAVAKRMNISRNRLIGLLIDSMEVEAEPSIKINLGQNKSATPTVQAGNGAFAVEN